MTVPQEFHVRREIRTEDLGSGISAGTLVERLQKVVPGLYLAEEYGSPQNPAICSLRQRFQGERQLQHGGQPFLDRSDTESLQTDNYVAPLYRGVLPEHDLWTADGKKPLLYGWRHVLMLVSTQCKVRLMDLERATGLRVQA